MCAGSSKTDDGFLIINIRGDSIYMPGGSVYNSVMRVFFGIGLDDSSREALLHAMIPYRSMGSSIRWTAPQNIHLTVKFLGEIKPSVFSRLVEALDHPSRLGKKFVMKITHFGKFPSGRGVSIFWAGITPDPALTELGQNLDERLRPFDFPREDRPFTPHITLGRNKSTADFSRLCQSLEEQTYTAIVHMPVSSFQLFESRLTPQGPIYTVKKELPLA